MVKLFEYCNDCSIYKLQSICERDNNWFSKLSYVGIVFDLSEYLEMRIEKGDCTLSSGLSLLIYVSFLFNI